MLVYLLMLMTPVFLFIQSDNNFVFVSTIFNKKSYLTFKSIFHKALKDGIIAT